MREEDLPFSFFLLPVTAIYMIRKNSFSFSITHYYKQVHTKTEILQKNTGITRPARYFSLIQLSNSRAGKGTAEGEWGIEEKECEAAEDGG